MGGLAASARGRPRFTKDVDFLVGDEAFSRSGPSTGHRVPILAGTWLTYMKLASPRGKDRDDIVGMLEADTVDRAALEAAIAGDAELEERWALALRELALTEE